MAGNLGNELPRKGLKMSRPTNKAQISFWSMIPPSILETPLIVTNVQEINTFLVPPNGKNQGRNGFVPSPPLVLDPGGGGQDL